MVANYCKDTVLYLREGVSPSQEKSSYFRLDCMHVARCFFKTPSKCFEKIKEINKYILSIDVM